MMKSSHQENWAAQLLLSANAQLESHYRQQASACLALQIARNDRLLTEQDEHPLKQQLWQSLARRWWLSYQLHCGHLAHCDVSELL